MMGGGGREGGVVVVWVVEEGVKFDVGVSNLTAREIPNSKFSKVQTSNLYPARKRLVEKIPT